MVIRHEVNVDSRFEHDGTRTSIPVRAMLSVSGVVSDVALSSPISHVEKKFFQSPYRDVYNGAPPYSGGAKIGAHKAHLSVHPGRPAPPTKVDRTGEAIRGARI